MWALPVCRQIGGHGNSRSPIGTATAGAATGRARWSLGGCPTGRLALVVGGASRPAYSSGPIGSGGSGAPQVVGRMAGHAAPALVGRPLRPAITAAGDERSCTASPDLKAAANAAKNSQAPGKPATKAKTRQPMATKTRMIDTPRSAGRIFSLKEVRQRRRCGHCAEPLLPCSHYTAAHGSDRLLLRVLRVGLLKVTVNLPEAAARWQGT